MTVGDYFALAALVLNFALAPAVLVLWSHERRITRCETVLKINPQEAM